MKWDIHIPSLFLSKNLKDDNVRVTMNWSYDLQISIICLKKRLKFRSLL